jgi:thioredoxin-dependent adenylylsulfate APS reductase
MAAAAVALPPRKPPNDELLEFIGSGRAEAMDAEELLTWGIGNFAPSLALSCSFGAPEGLALLDMMHRLDPRSRVFVIDTGRLPQATYDLIDRVRDRYGKAVEVIFPRAEDVQALVAERGMNLFYESVENRQACCRVRKVEPLARYLAGLDAWVSGLRRDQGVTRGETPKLELDRAHGGIVKLNPIADWTHDAILDYVRAHEVPVNRLHAQGYPSVGCDPCSRAVGPGDDPRSGRWWWELPETRECGIHVGEESEGSGI